MMTAASIGAGQAADYGAYLESRTVAPSRGDYYLSAEGEPVEAPGRWHMLSETLERLGLRAGEQVRANELVALMEGRHPTSGEFIRRAGCDGRRAAGIDLTFSAPKSVSVAWALGDGEQRAGIEAAHGRAVEQVMDYLRSEVRVVREGAGGAVLARARDVIAAEYRHTTARGVASGGLPDPQLHSHVVVTGVVRRDRRFAAVASRPIFRTARELGSFYRAALAAELREQGFAIEAGTGREGRYFEIGGVPESLREKLSGRSREVWLAAERFRARYGRAPARGELRSVKLENRRAKTPQTRADLDRAWRECAREHGFGEQQAAGLRERGGELLRDAEEPGWEVRVERSLTSQRATFERSELRASVLEQGVGETPARELAARAGALLQDGRVVRLGDGRMTTARVRRMERQIERRVGELARQGGADVGAGRRERAASLVADRVGEPLSAQQERALAVLTGEERAAVLVGQAGTGKGVVIDAAVSAELLAGREPVGVAVAGATAERLGVDSPSLFGRTMTLDALLARAQTGSVTVDHRTSVYFDEAGMADTKRLEALCALVERTGGKLVLIGDERQLPSIGAGGMFARLRERAPSAALSEVKRTPDADERRAWADLRAGRPEEAMAHYQSRGQLHLADTRDEAVERAVDQWAALTERLDVREVALISDASNVEIERLSARAQQLRSERRELGAEELPLPGVAYGLRAGDRVAFIAQHRPEGEPRVENGTRAVVVDVDPGRDQARLVTEGSGRELIVGGEDLGSLRLAYAQHLYRQQGATVQRSVVVTGGWQTSREGAYVEASRARQGTDWHVSREDLGLDGVDGERIARLAELMRASRAQVPSLAFAADGTDEGGVSAELERSTARQVEMVRERSVERGIHIDRDVERDGGMEIGL
jgi:conjugative relaxase-like TrwC/TraI family protein